MSAANVITIILKHGNASVNSTFTGVIGEVTVDTTGNTIRVHDGLTIGGNILATQTYVNAAVSTATINTSALLATNANIAAANVEIVNLWTNAVTQGNSITSLISNAAVQSNAIVSLGADVVAANLMIDTVNANWFANVATVNSNVAIANLAINSLRANAVMQDSNISVLVSNAAVQSNAIVALNANVTAANVEIVSLWSNAASQGNSITILTSNAATQSNAIAVLNANIIAANIEIVNLWSNAALQANSLTSLNANITAANVEIVNLWANAVTQGNVITVLTGNIASHSNAIAILNANVAAANVAINSNHIWTLVDTLANLTFVANANTSTMTGTISAYGTSYKEMLIKFGRSDTGITTTLLPLVAISANVPYILGYPTTTSVGTNGPSAITWANLSLASVTITHSLYQAATVDLYVR